MAIPREPEWDLDPHTIGKHAVLRAYLNAWIPIMGQTQPRMVFIDGFAGPGRYRGGEDGSPIIAMKALIEHESKHRVKQMKFLFVENEPTRAALLTQRVDELRSHLPPGSDAGIRTGMFSAEIDGILDSLEAANQRLAPALMMVDPFGVSDVPLQTLARFLKGTSKELYISFMCESMQRFVDTEEFAPHLDAMFGSPAWRESAGAADRMERLHRLYEERLRAIGAKYVLRFSVRSGGRHIYTLFFATKHPKGCDVMKQAMWKVAPEGDYTFNGKGLEQMTLSFFNGNTGELDRILLDEYRDQPRVTVPELEAFMQSDRLRFHSGQLRQSLKRLEANGGITVDASTRTRKGTFPPTCELSFVRP